MRIERIKLEHFRNIDTLTLEPCESVNVIHGNNAQGKTNILEGIYLFTGDRSFRGSKDYEFIQFGKNRAALEVEFHAANRRQKAALEVTDKKTAVLNGIALSSISKLDGIFPAVLFSPAHLSLIKQEPAQRRKFVDNALSQIKAPYRLLIRQYHQALAQRNAILRKINNDRTEMQKVQDTELWDMTLSAMAGRIVWQRDRYIERLKPLANHFFHGLSGGSEALDLTFQHSYAPEIGSDGDASGQFYAYLRDHIDSDIHLGATSAGPHRDDMEIKINGVSAKLYGSQGQQRSCVLALKLAEAALLQDMTGEPPAALLDDVMSELDESRQDYIMNHLEGWQVFITCCEVSSLLRLKGGKTFQIQEGRLV